MTNVRITDEVDEAATAELRERVISYNVATTGIDDGRSLCCYVRDASGALIAGLAGFSWGGYAKIEWLWVREDHRGGGLGAQLIGAAEAEAGRRGCGVVRVDTHTFQAPGFYEKLGYERVGSAADTPIGHGEVFFLKRIRTNAESDHGGLSGQPISMTRDDPGRYPQFDVGRGSTPPLPRAIE